MRSLAFYREYCRSFLDFACLGTTGRSEVDPVYQDVTEGRDVGAMQRKYSSCGDLAHAMLYALGCRAPFVNRAEHFGWRVGLNLNLLYRRPFGTNPYAVAYDGSPLDSGDVLVVSNKVGGHVICVLGEADGVLYTAEYGTPGGQLRRHSLSETFTKTIGSVLRLEDVIAGERMALEPPDMTLLESWLTGEELDALESL